MSVIYLGSRPIVPFDANSVDHRKWFASFVKYNTWGRCPVRFMTDSLEKDLVSHVEHKMLHYYVTQEFTRGKVNSKSQTKSWPKKALGAVSHKLTVQTKTGQIKGTVPALSKARTK